MWYKCGLTNFLYDGDLDIFWNVIVSQVNGMKIV